MMNKKQYARLERIIAEVREIVEEEQVKLDNAPENLRDSKLFTQIEENISDLEEVIDTLENVVLGQR